MNKSACPFLFLTSLKLMVVGAFYIMGAATTFLTGIVFSLDDHYIVLLLKLERAQTVPMFGGAIISVFFYVSAPGQTTNHIANVDPDILAGKTFHLLIFVASARIRR